jgi:hypothetical protein
MLDMALPADELSVPGATRGVGPRRNDARQ